MNRFKLFETCATFLCMNFEQQKEKEKKKEKSLECILTI